MASAPRPKEHTKGKESLQQVANTSKRPKEKRDGTYILRRALKTNFTNGDEAKKFAKDYKDKIQKVGKQNSFLHALAQSDQWPPDMEGDKMKEFLQWALGPLGGYHSWLEEKNKYGYTPFHMALMDRNQVFIETVLQSDEPVNPHVFLPQACPHGNSLHVAVRHSLSHPTIDLLVAKCARIETIFTSTELPNGNTPLHVCMSMDLDEQKDEDDQNDYSSSETSDSDDDNPQKTAISLQKGDDQLNIATEVLEPQPAPVTRMTRAATERLKPHRPQASSTSLAERLTGEDTQEALRIVMLLIDTRNSVLWLHNNTGRTPYQERIHQLRTAGEKQFRLTMGAESLEKYKLAAHLDDVVAADPITKYIRSYCVRNFDRERIMKSLYKPGQERHIEFDLGGLPHPNISLDYLVRLQKHLHFESILKYVALPKLTMEPTRSVRRLKPIQRPSDRRGLSDLVHIFRWLGDNQVKKIVKVMVVDDGDPCHADESIEEAMKGFEVEIWDWKRIDLNSDVIAKSSELIREMSLYSSGNKAVLMGWASPEGLPNRTKFGRLEKVNLFIREGQDDPKRLQEYISEFKTTIAKRTEGKVKVEVTLDNKEESYASGFKGSEEQHQMRSSWIECLASFSKLLRTNELTSVIEPVKVAIIDDGVDASLLSLDGLIAIGKSFCPYAGSNELMSPYYVPSGNHGTCMAALICKISHNVRLYVARLNERQSTGSGQRNFTAQSAADAVRWATNCGVDIISMSWTIETPITDHPDMLDLQEAVKEAATKKILMFCSTSDQGNSTTDRCYPGDFPACIRIGGATDTGEALAWVNDARVEFLLPGKNVPFHNNEGRIVSYESGSSVATAAASGLAALFLVCNRLLSAKENSPDSPQYISKGYESMRRVFKVLASKEHSNFPDVMDFFDHKFKRALARAELGNESKGLTQKADSYDLSHMTWGPNHDKALRSVMDIIREELAKH